MPKKLVLGIKRGFGFRKILVKVQIRSPTFPFWRRREWKTDGFFLGLGKGGNFINNYDTEIFFLSGFGSEMS